MSTSVSPPARQVAHVTFAVMMVDDDFLNEGTMFAVPSIAGWKAINESPTCC